MRYSINRVPLEQFYIANYFAKKKQISSDAYLLTIIMYPIVLPYKNK